MSIIVEDGNIIANSNSYIDDTYLSSYALSRGISLPATEAERDVLLINAMDYIEAIRSKFKGSKTDSDNQELQWPRSGVYIDNKLIDKNSIPEDLKKAQAQLAIESQSLSLFVTEDGTSVKKEKLDVLEVEYFNSGSSGQPTFAKVDAYLSELIKLASKGSTLTRV